MPERVAWRETLGLGGRQTPGCVVPDLLSPSAAERVRVTLLHDTYFDHVCGVGGRLAWRVVLVGGVA